MANHSQYPRIRHPVKPQHWWNRPTVKWAGTAIATPVLVGVLIWAIQQPFTPSPRPSATPESHTPSPTPTHPAGPPVSVDLVQVEHTDLHNTWIFPQAVILSGDQLARLNALPKDSDAQHRWFRQQGGVDPGSVDLKIVVHGNADRPVRIVGMMAVPRCGPPLTGTLFESPSAGSEDTIKIGLDLDETDPRGKTLINDSEWGGDYFQQKTISLKRDEEIAFQVIAKTQKHYCEFSIALDVLSNGKLIGQSIDDHGKPFKVSARNIDYASYQKMYIGGVANPDPDGKWLSVDPQTYQ